MNATAMKDEAAFALADALDAALPQTQCTRCGYPDCRGYAEAMAAGDAAIDRCPPGGAEGIARLAALTGRAPLPLDPACGSEAPLRLAAIDEAACIGCTLCIKACPVDCIVGAAKHMHTVITAQCTGCELCLPACPVDCIFMEAARPGTEQPTGWAAWSATQAEQARARYRARQQRLLRAGQEREAGRAAAPPERKASVIEAALARARARRS